ncbi:MAG: hypothetical protein ABSD74_01345 [Rhizomicrobium sp.]|jgi:hypothetical protein
MPFGVPDGGTEVENILDEQGGLRFGRILGTIGALLGTFVVLVGSALTVDLINSHDPRAEVGSLGRRVQQFRAEMLAQTFAFRSAANNQRSAARVVIDVLGWTDVSNEEAERDKQTLTLAFENYESALDNVRALLNDADEDFALGGDASHPQNSQLAAFFDGEALLAGRARLFAGCLVQNVDVARNRTGASASPPATDPDASAPEGEPRQHGPDVQCATFTDNRGMVHSGFVLDETALRALDTCETHFGRELVEAARILNHTASANSSAADNLSLTQRLGMEARRERLWQGPQTSDWSAANADLARGCEPLKQFGSAPAPQ